MILGRIDFLRNWVGVVVLRGGAICCWIGVAYGVLWLIFVSGHSFLWLNFPGMILVFGVF